MYPLIVLLIFISYFLFVNTQHQYLILYLSQAISLCYLIHNKHTITLTNFFHSQILIQQSLLIWHYLIPKPLIIFYLPLTLSSIGKLLYILYSNYKKQTMQRKLIILQNKAQLIMLIYQLGIFFRSYGMLWIQTISLLIIIKFKHIINIAMQIASYQLGSTFEAMAVQMKLAKVFKIIQQIVSALWMVGNDNFPIGKKEVSLGYC